MSNRDALKHLGAVTSTTRAIAGEIADHLTSLGYTLPRYGAPYSGPVMHGYDPNPGNKEHHSKRAIDVMVMAPGPMGDAVADFVWKHRDRYDLQHVIWKQRIRSTKTQPGVWRGMADRGSGTNNHMDHTHIWFGPNAKPLGSSGGGSQSTAPAPKPKATYYKPTGTDLSVRQIQAIVGVKADGYYGDDTKAAVKKYQKSMGFTSKHADGLWGPKTQAAHNKKGKPAKAPAKPASKPADKGATYPALVVDGKFGPRTIRRLQQEVGVTVDGIAGPQTWRAVQKWVGATQDGIRGPKTIKAMQRKLGVSQTGRWTHFLVSALQRHLNANRKK